MTDLVNTKQTYNILIEYLKIMALERFVVVVCVSYESRSLLIENLIIFLFVQISFGTAVHQSINL